MNISMAKRLEEQRKYYELEKTFEWKEWINKIPYIQFPPSWQVKAIPPFAAALIRYAIKTPDIDDFVSVYLDAWEALGFWDGKPYWEIYNSCIGEPMRFDMDDVKGLLEGIESILADIKKFKGNAP